VVVLAGEVQRGAALVIELEEERDCDQLLRGEEGRSGRWLTCGEGGARGRRQEELHALGVASRSREVERREARLVSVIRGGRGKEKERMGEERDLVSGTGVRLSGGEQEPHQQMVAEEGGEVERSVTVLVHGVHRGPVVAEEQPGDADLPSLS
jgi:hypothetical protein